MKTVTASLILLLSSTAFAISGECRGTHQGEEILLSGYAAGSDPREGVARVSVAGREVALFEGQDARINYLFQSARVMNPQGDELEGKVVSLTEKTALITKLVVRGFGIDYRNIPVSCWIEN